MFEEFKYSDPPQKEFVYRRQKRVTTAITLSHLEAWEEDLAPEELRDFFSRRKIPQDGSAHTQSRNYAQVLYQVFWKKYNYPVEVDKRILKAATDVTNLGSLNWAGCIFNLPLDEAG